MCSKDEWKERQTSREISVFEATAASTHLPQQRRRLDPCRAVAKYRRSAAGTTRSREPRSYQALETTVFYILEILATQRDSSNVQHTLLETVNFVEDRLRAVQVDLTITCIASKYLQSFMIRAHILILYLLVDLSQYQAKFGHQALQTAFSNYWLEIEQAETDEEIMCLETIYELSKSLQMQGDSSASIFYSLRKHVTISDLSLLQWTLKLCSAATLGHWHCLLRLLYDTAVPRRVTILARCLLAPCLPSIRWQALQAYNVSFTKQEAIPGVDMVRLLFFESDEKALDFIENVAGLPIEKPVVLFKATPIKPFTKCSLAIREDNFVFDEDSNDVSRIDENGTRIPSLSFISRLLNLPSHPTVQSTDSQH